MQSTTYVMHNEGLITSIQQGPAIPEHWKYGLIEAPRGTTMTSHYVVNGELVAYTPEQRALRENQPSAYHVWNQESMEWVDTKTLEQYKADQWEDTKRQRDMILNSAISYNGLLFDADDKSKQAIQAASIAAQADPNYIVVWTLFDNSSTPLNAEQLIELHGVITKRTAEIMQKSQEIRTYIDSCEDINAVLNSPVL